MFPPKSPTYAPSDQIPETAETSTNVFNFDLPDIANLETAIGEQSTSPKDPACELPQQKDDNFRDNSPQNFELKMPPKHKTTSSLEALPLASKPLIEPKTPPLPESEKKELPVDQMTPPSPAPASAPAPAPASAPAPAPALGTSKTGYRTKNEQHVGAWRNAGWWFRSS